MALETVVYPQDPFSYYGFKDFYSLLGGSNWGYDLFLQQQQQQQQQELDQEGKSSLVGIFNHNNNNIIMDQTQNGHHDVHANWDYSSSPQPNSAQHMSTTIKDQLLGLASLMDPNSSPEAPTVFSPQPGSADPSPAAATAGELPVMGRRKRRRARSSKNKEELETQRMTHIAVERNRRKQMNEYLAVLRSLMPPSYVQRGDQASIIGGAINFVKELEQFLQSMESHHKRAKRDDHDHDHDRDQNRDDNRAGGGLAEFFTFPQYSTRSNYNTVNSAVATENSNSSSSNNNNNNNNNNRLAEADIEVTMVDSHANLKILAKKRPRLLLKLVTGLQALGLGILHLNATTAAQMVLYSVSVKVEEGSQLNTVDEIAASVNQMLGRIQEEPVFT